jgi:hypothetical protein
LSQEKQQSESDKLFIISTRFQSSIVEFFYRAGGAGIPAFFTPTGGGFILVLNLRIFYSLLFNKNDFKGTVA